MHFMYFIYFIHLMYCIYFIHWMCWVHLLHLMYLIYFILVMVLRAHLKGNPFLGRTRGSSRRWSNNKSKTKIKKKNNNNKPSVAVHPRANPAHRDLHTSLWEIPHSDMKPICAKRPYVATDALAKAPFSARPRPVAGSRHEKASMLRK